LSNYKIIVLFEGQGVKENGKRNLAQIGEHIGVMAVKDGSVLNRFKRK
jgi:hypothetical protein